MFKNLRIANFRALGNLQIERLGKINLLTGGNNSGKTTLLEALFLLSGAGNPQVLVKVNSIRGVDSASGSLASISDILWKPIFAGFDTKKQIKIEAVHDKFGQMELELALEQPDTFQLPLNNSGNGSALTGEATTKNALEFRLSMNGLAGDVGRMWVTTQGLQIQPTNTEPIFDAVFLSSRIGAFQEDAVRLGQLRKRKQGDLVLDALRVVEPRLQSVEDNSSSGFPLIWGDVGLPELAPLPVMGEGMVRIARLILAISAAPNGIVLIDEIENGLHHSSLSNVWHSVYQAAEQFNTQIFASTHSYECVQAAHEALDANCFLLHRLERKRDSIECISYESEASQAAFLHNLEVR